MASSRLDGVRTSATATHAGRDVSDVWEWVDIVVWIVFTRLCQRMAYWVAKTMQKRRPAPKKRPARLSVRVVRMIKASVKITNRRGMKTWREKPRNRKAISPTA